MVFATAVTCADQKIFTIKPIASTASAGVETCTVASETATAHTSKLSANIRDDIFAVSDSFMNIADMALQTKCSVERQT